MAVYKGFAQVVIDNAGLGTRAFILRTNNATPGDQTTWELVAGASVTLTYNVVAAGATPPGGADGGVTLAVYYETGTGTLVRTLVSGGSPADGSTYTFYATNTGLVDGTPRAGTMRLFVEAIRTSVPTYNRNSDGTGGSGIAASQTDQGVLRGNAKVSDLTVSAYPSGATFAHVDAITLTATHTQRFADRNNEIIRIDLLDGSAQQAAGSSQEVGATTTTTQAFTCNDSTFDAASKSYGMRFTVVNNALLVPTSGAIKWTKLIDDGANVTVNAAGDEAERQSFFTADPRVSGKAGDGSAGFHFQINRASFDPSFHDPSLQGLAPDSMQAAIRIVNARGEGVNGLSVTLTADPTIQGTTVTLSTSTSTLASEAGWTGLIDVCPSGKPGGIWALAADITAPTSIDDPTYFLTSTTSINVILDDPRLALRVAGGDPATPTDHWRIGKQLVVGLTALRIEGGVGSQAATRVAYDTDSARFFVASFNPALARVETMSSDEVTWTFTDTPYLFTPALSPGDSKTGLYTFDAADTAQWGNRSIFLQGYALINGVPKMGAGDVETTGTANLHTGYKIDPFALVMSGIISTR